MYSSRIYLAYSKIIFSSIIFFYSLSFCGRLAGTAAGGVALFFGDLNNNITTIPKFKAGNNCSLDYTIRDFR